MAESLRVSRVRLKLAVLRKLRVTAEPGVTCLRPYSFVGRDVEASRAGFFELLEVAFVATGVDDGVLVATASTFVERTAVDLRVVARVHITGTFRKQEDIVFEREYTAGFLGSKRPFPHICAASSVHCN